LGVDALGVGWWTRRDQPLSAVEVVYLPEAHRPDVVRAQIENASRPESGRRKIGLRM
jgi:hypothetical protein